MDIKFLVDNYDGVYVTKKAARGLKMGAIKLPVQDLGTWDVDSICVFTPDVVIPIEENSFDKAKINDYSAPNEYQDNTRYSGKNGRQMDHDYNLYGNRNLDKDMSKFFNGKHPAIVAQGDGRRADTKQARAFNGTLKSGLKEERDLEEDRTLYHGTRADFNQFDLAYLSSGWGQQD